MTSNNTSAEQHPASNLHASTTIVATGGVETALSVSQPASPPLMAQAANLFQSVVSFVGDGCGTVDDATYRQRLEICHACDRLCGERCSACGCFINVKARGRIFRCPIGRWQ